MSTRPRLPWSYQSAPPCFFLLALNAPQPEAPRLPQDVFIEAAAKEDANETLEYALDASKFPEVASSAVGSGEPSTLGRHIAQPHMGRKNRGDIFGAHWRGVGFPSLLRRPRGRCHCLRSTPIWRRTCAAVLHLLAPRPRTRSAAVNKSLLGPLQSSSRYFLIHFRCL